MTDIIRSPRPRARRVRRYVGGWACAARARVAVTDVDRLTVLVRALLRTAAVAR